MGTLVYIHSFNLYLLSTYCEPGHFLGNWGYISELNTQHYLPSWKGKEWEGMDELNILKSLNYMVIINR